MDIELQSKLLRLKGFLNEINHISYSYSQIGKNHPMNMVDNEKAKKLLKAYEELLNSVKNLILNYESKDTSHSVLDR